MTNPWMSVEQLFATRMKEARNAQGLSQAALAKKLNEIGLMIGDLAILRIEKKVDQTAVSRVEQATRTVRLSEAVAIAYVLGIDLSDLTRSSSLPLQEQIARAEKTYADAETNIGVAHVELERARERLNHLRALVNGGAS